MKKLYLIFTFFSFILLLLMTSPSVKAATQVYVSPGESIQEAIDSLGNSGGEVIIKGGTYFEKIRFNNSGKKENPIILRTEGKVIIDGHSENDYAFDLNGKSNIVINGLEIKNLKGNNVSAIRLGGNESNIQITNNKIYNLYENDEKSEVSSILVSGGNSKKTENILIKGNDLSGTVYIKGNVEYIYVQNNIIHDSLHQGIYSDDALNILIKDNIVYKCNIGIEVGGRKNSTNYKSNLIISNNLVYDCFQNGLYIGNTESVKNIKIYNNTLLNNSTELYLGRASEIEIHHNIFSNLNSFEVIYSEYGAKETKDIIFHDNIYNIDDSSIFYFEKSTHSQSEWKENFEETALFQDPKLDYNYLPTPETPANTGYISLYGRQGNENSSLINNDEDLNAIYYSGDPTKKDVEIFLQYDIIIFDKKYSNPNNKSYIKMQKLIEDIKAQNPDVNIIFAKKMG